jgi:hypothetical protein
MLTEPAMIVPESKVDVARNNTQSHWLKVLRKIAKREYIIEIVRYIRVVHRALQSHRIIVSVRLDPLIPVGRRPPPPPG